MNALGGGRTTQLEGKRASRDSWAHEGTEIRTRLDFRATLQRLLSSGPATAGPEDNPSRGAYPSALLMLISAGRCSPSCGEL